MAKKTTRKRTAAAKRPTRSASSRGHTARSKPSKKKAAKKKAKKKTKKNGKKKATRKKTSKKAVKKKTTKKKAAAKKRPGTSARSKAAGKAKKKTTKKKAATTRRKTARGKAAGRKVAKKKPVRAAHGPRRKTAASSGSRAAGRTKLTRTDLARFRALLIEERERLVGDLQSLESQAFKTSGQDSSANHMADFGSDNYEQDFTLGLIENNEDRVRQIDRALAKIEEGTFGVCEGCSAPIPLARLEVLPWTPYCIRCKELLERPY